MNIAETEISAKIKKVLRRIEQAALSVGRDPSRIDLIAVTKQKEPVVIKELVEKGINKIGESYLKEALFKQQLLAKLDIEWHMIGMIQRGKEQKIVKHFEQIHSVDRLELAVEINKEASQLDKIIPIYLECNVSGESTKHGWETYKDDLWDQITPDIAEICDLESLRVQGLMTMAPYSKNPEDSRPYFVRLHKLLDFLNNKFPNSGFTGLSMGMSGDFEPAVQEGATILRIGSALVGQR